MTPFRCADHVEIKPKAPICGFGFGLYVDGGADVSRFYDFTRMEGHTERLMEPSWFEIETSRTKLTLDLNLLKNITTFSSLSAL